MAAWHEMQADNMSGSLSATVGLCCVTHAHHQQRRAQVQEGAERRLADAHEQRRRDAERAAGGVGGWRFGGVLVGRRVENGFSRGPACLSSWIISQCSAMLRRARPHRLPATGAHHSSPSPYCQVRLCVRHHLGIGRKQRKRGLWECCQAHHQQCAHGGHRRQRLHKPAADACQVAARVSCRHGLRRCCARGVGRAGGVCVCVGGGAAGWGTQPCHGVTCQALTECTGNAAGLRTSAWWAHL